MTFLPKSDETKEEAIIEATAKDDVEIGQMSSLDEGELFLQEHGVTNTQLEEMLNDSMKSKKLRRKVDLMVLPLLCGTYVLQYIDKQALAYSAVFDLFTDANINSNQYSWLISIFYFGLVSSPLLTTALGIPQGAFQVFFILSGSYLSTRFKNIRTIIMMVYLIPTTIGISLLWKLPRTNRYGVLFGYYILGSYVSSLVLSLQMPSSNMGGYTKRVTATAFVFLAYCIGNIIGPHAFLAKEAPIYQTGCKLVLACALCQVACAACLRVLLVRRNKRREVKVRADPAVQGADGDVMADLTDFENPRFRYVL
ncbi:hypothetical protein APSETT444_008024 [Aspergillus pseudonomiae]